MIDRRPIIGVMGSHEDSWDDYSMPLGERIARFGYHLLTGAGGGAMSAVAKAFTETDDRDGVSIGVVPVPADYKGALLSRDQYPNPYIEIPIVTPLSPKAELAKTPYSRNMVNIITPNAIIVLPGAQGTQTETSLSLMYNKPLLLFGPEKAFKGFPEAAVGAEDEESLEEFLTYVRKNIRAAEEEEEI